MNKHLSKRLLSLMLAVALCVGLVLPAAAAGASDNAANVTFEKVDNDAVSVKPVEREEVTETPEPAPYADTETVRVSIVLSGESTIKKAGSTENIAANASAMAYRATLETVQDMRIASISKVIGEPLDVVQQLTLVANIISANVEYGQIEAIERVPGVVDVVIETRYEPAVVNTEEAADPNMATSGKQIGSAAAWADGYTGAGSRIAIIDTGLDIDHQSFTAGGFEYSLAYLAGKAGKTVDEYKAGLNLLDADEIAAVADQLHVTAAASGLYRNSKVPFAYNYVDEDLDIVHINDTQGEHGSHVAGIATANAYVPSGDTYVHALEAVNVQGVAPDAQLMVMKVFGKGGGAYDSDYMVAIEDAIILNADSVNLSLGSGNPGMSRNSNEIYQNILDDLQNCGTVVVMSAGNSGSWVENAQNLGYLYADDVSMDTAGSPGSYTNSLSVASVDNDGATGAYFMAGDEMVLYNETAYTNEPLATLDGVQDYVFIDGMGTETDWDAVGEALTGKIAFCSRGSISFSQKAEFAVAAGAIATIIYNNQAGVINMDLSDYKQTAPAVSITQADGAAVKAASTAVTDSEGNVLYYTGTINIADGVGSAQYNSDYYTMSSFSSWGVPGSLELKPEITAPGGSIYSVNGTHKDAANGPVLGSTTAYENMSGTSMAAPQVTGMAAVVGQYIRENGLEEKTGLSARQLAMSLLMSTAVPMIDGNSGCYYPVLQQGSGLANVGAAVSAKSYILMGEDATASAADGKVKVELGDDPDLTGKYTFSFSVNNLTDEPQSYALSADFFTQDLFMYYANGNQSMDQLAYYMDTVGFSLPVVVSWVVDGKTLSGDSTDGLIDMDFNGDGTITEADGQALLDYATGARETLSNQDNADLNGDGSINTYDAYLFFNKFNAGALVVPANGSVNVTATVELTDAWDEYLAVAGNGIYVEGYVFVDSLSTAEGVKGETHSIPVLGFYGNWSDPSMFEVGSYPEYAAGDEYRIPYLGKADANAWLITYANEPRSTYAFGGNPLVPDSTYMPERNAINSENGDSISKVQFTSIRNASASRYAAVNETTNELLAEGLPGVAVYSAYYYVNGGAWKNTGYSLNTKFVPKGIEEGNQLKLSLTLVPEYYGEGDAIDWDALGEGATFSVPMVVDNTAPELKDVSVSLTGNTMTVTASDNQYVAAVALYNKAGTKVYTFTGAKQDIAPGETAEYVMDLSEVNGSRFLVQVFDYAMNAATYVIEMQIGEKEPMPEMIAFDLDENYWTTFTKDTTYSEISAYSPTSNTFVAATIVDHLVLAGTMDGDLYVMPEDDLTDETMIANMGAVVTDMAYNKADGNVYGVTNGYLVTVDKLTGELGVVGEIGVVTNTLACDANGTFYCNKYGSGEVYSFTLDTIAEPELLVATNLRTSQYIQAMEINPNNGMLCWNSYYSVSFLGFTFGYSYYYEIDTATGEYTRYNDLWDEMAALIIPEKTSGGSGWTEPTDKVSGVQISEEQITLLKGSSATLTATVQPWTATDRTVTWTTADASIATVDQKGVVTAVAPGTTTVTATSNLDPTVSTSCTVTVELLDVTVHGMLQDAEGKLQTFDWNFATDKTWTGGQKFEGNIISAAATGKGTAYATSSSGDTIVSLDLTTGETATVGAAPVPNSDMAFSEFSTEEQDLLEAVFYYYYLPAKDPANITDSAFDFSNHLSQYTGGSEFVGVATDGWTTYNGYDAEIVYLLDNAGYIWQLKVYEKTEGSYSCGISFIPTDLVDAGYEMTYDSDENTLSSLAVGEGGCLYFSGFNGDTNVIYRLKYNAAAKAFEAIAVGDVGADAWPAVLFNATSNETADGAAIEALAVEDTATAESVEISAEEMIAAASVKSPMTMNFTSKKVVDNSRKDSTAAEQTSEPVTGGLNSVVSYNKTATERPVMPLSEGTVSDDESTVTLDVTAWNAEGVEIDTKNGLVYVGYNPDSLELVSFVPQTQYSSWKEIPRDEFADANEIVFGYVDLEGIPAGAPIAKVTFKVLNSENPNLVVIHSEANEDTDFSKLEFISVIDQFDHDNTEVRDAKEATCTEPGYTGDTYCKDCGKLVEEGEEIPALGHDWGEWVETVSPTATEPGYEMRTCKRCGVDECREIPAKGEPIPIYPPIEPPTLPAGTPSASVKDDMPFVDVKPGDWFYKDVEYVWSNGLMKGVDDTHFGPNGALTRGMIVTILYRMENEPAVRTEGTFSDVALADWFGPAVEWAAKNGIVNGYDNGKFGPNDNITREQLAAILYRYAKYKGYDVSVGEDTNILSYEDAESVSEYAIPALQWACGEGLINGADGKLMPTSSATRAQVAAIIHRFLEGR